MNAREKFYDLMLSRRDCTIKSNANCFGTGLYRTFEKDSDGYLENPMSVLEKLEVTESPGVGDLAVWINDTNKPYHIATIVKEYPLTVSTRNGEGKIFKERELFSSTDWEYSKAEYNKDRIEYRTPSKLKKMLDAEANN